MPRMYRFRRLVVGLATVATVTLLAPLAVTAEEEVADLAPVAAPAAVGTSPEEVRAIRVLAAQHALQRGDIGSMQEDALYAIVAAAPSWDATSGYGIVEAGRAANSALLAPAAPTWDATSGYGAVEASRATIGSPATSPPSEQTRVLTAQQALQSPDLGSLQEEALLAVVSAGQSWDETSGYGSVEAIRVANALPVAPVASTTQVPADARWAPAGTSGPESSMEASLAVSLDYLPVALGTGTRSESVHLATIALGGDAVSVNPSDDRMAAALFTD
jgi:hypothetical protein